MPLPFLVSFQSFRSMQRQCRFARGWVGAIALTFFNTSPPGIPSMRTRCPADFPGSPTTPTDRNVNGTRGTATFNINVTDANQGTGKSEKLVFRIGADDCYTNHSEKDSVSVWRKALGPNKQSCVAGGSTNISDKNSDAADADAGVCVDKVCYFSLCGRQLRQTLR